jgi:hypothetical protein
MGLFLRKGFRRLSNNSQALSSKFNPAKQPLNDCRMRSINHTFFIQVGFFSAPAGSSRFQRFLSFFKAVIKTDSWQIPVLQSISIILMPVSLFALSVVIDDKAQRIAASKRRSYHTI